MISSTLTPATDTRVGTGRRSFLTGLLGGSVGVALGALWSPRAAAAASADGAPEADGPSIIDTGFCHDMTAHHVQALVMCERVLGQATGDPVQAAATEVLRNQSIEVGMMRAWLADWGEPTSTQPTAMGWMGMNGGDGIPTETMPGLATDDELRALSLATGRAQGTRWLELMRTHHEAGVAMASAAVQKATLDKVRRLATTQAAVQAFEIEQYDLLLATTYA